MSNTPTTAFTDNWAYLKTELNWLDRMLMVAVARQRKDTKEIDRIAQTRADRISSHWWKGVISLEGSPVYDDCRKPPQPINQTKQSYQQQLDVRIQATQAEGVMLALPALCDRLQLSHFEKNLILMSLAPEVNRRYGHIYQYLQGDPSAKTDLPTVDIVLRLLCRNDQEWRTARLSLLEDSPLIRSGLLRILPCATSTFLNQPLRLADPVVDFLLAEQPKPEALEQLLEPDPTRQKPTFLQHDSVAVDWSELVLPTPLVTSLRELGRGVHYREQVDEVWGFGQEKRGQATALGTFALLVGKAGTGRTLAARAIAHALNTPLVSVDLASVKPEDYNRLLQEITTHEPTVLLLQSAQLWLKRSASIDPATLHQFWRQRRHSPSMTLMNVPLQESVMLQWQRQIDRVLRFPIPDRSDRLTLWHRAFPAQFPLADDIDWEAIAQQLPLTGGEIRAIARAAALYLASTGEAKLTLEHLVQVLAEQGKSVKVSPLRKKRTRKKHTSPQSE